MIKVIVLCGSLRFKKEFQELYEKLSIEGNLVLMPVFFENIKDEEVDKKLLKEIHRQKINMADEVHFVNVNGYLGPDSIEELIYAQSRKKYIKFLEE